MIPIESKSYAKFEQAASVEYAQFGPVTAGILWEKMIKQYFGKTTDEERVKELIPQLESKLDGYEAILGRQKYIAGDVRSCGALAHVAKVVGTDGLLCAGGHPCGSTPSATWYYYLGGFRIGES